MPSVFPSSSDVVLTFIARLSKRESLSRRCCSLSICIKRPHTPVFNDIICSANGCLSSRAECQRCGSAIPNSSCGRCAPLETKLASKKASFKVPDNEASGSQTLVWRVRGARDVCSVASTSKSGGRIGNSATASERLRVSGQPAEGPGRSRLDRFKVSEPTIRVSYCDSS